MTLVRLTSVRHVIPHRSYLESGVTPLVLTGRPVICDTPKITDANGTVTGPTHRITTFNALALL